MPVGEIVPRALAATERGWTVVIAGIHRADIPAMNNERDLFYERDLRTVTAKTRTEGMPFCGPPPPRACARGHRLRLHYSRCRRG
jgi:hypothetical protein